MTWLGVGLCIGIALLSLVLYCALVVGSRADEWQERVAQEMERDNG